jgi:hypothetical protein
MSSCRRRCGLALLLVHALISGRAAGADLAHGLSGLLAAPRTLLRHHVLKFCVTQRPGRPHGLGLRDALVAVALGAVEPCLGDTQPALAQLLETRQAPDVLQKRAQVPCPQLARCP